MRAIVWGFTALASVGVLAACGSGTPAGPSATASATTATTPTLRSTPTASVSGTGIPVPDADSVAKILLAMPVAQRPVFLDPYGTAIHGDRLGLGPSLRIAGYRADPLFVCIQHVDVTAGRAGSWTAYAVTSTGVTDSRGSSGQCPPAPGRPEVRE